jgi:S-formylglutathione hydrolase FrmB
LPVGYNPDSNKFPVVYLLHCAGCTHKSVLDTIYFQGIHRQAVKSNFIMVSPCDDSGNRSNWWIDNPTHKNKRYSSFLIEELKPLIDSAYATLPGKSSTGYGGHSMGGYGALYNIKKHNDYVGAAFAINPCTELSNWQGNFGLDYVLGYYEKTVENWHMYSLNRNYKSFETLTAPIGIYTGTHDWFYNETREFHNKLESIDVDHFYHVSTASHKPVKEEAIEMMIDFFNKNLSVE